MDVLNEPGRTIGREIARGERAEAELDAFISRRSRQEGPDGKHALWEASVERHNARVRAENRAAWRGWHMDQAERHRRTLTALVSHHEAEAEKLLEGTDERRTA